MIEFNPKPDIPKPWRLFHLQNGSDVTVAFFATRAQARRAIYEAWKAVHPLPVDERGKAVEP